VTEERNRELVGRRDDEGSAVYPAPSSSSDLLDLVRSAEDDARLALRKRTPAVPMQLGSTDATGEEFVDVGDEAVDAPPSLPPLRAPTPASAFAVHGRASRPSASRMTRAPDARALRSWSPAVGMAVMLALAVGALLVLAR